jgi:hypothetical protein
MSAKSLGLITMHANYQLLEFLCQAQFLSWYTLVTVIFFLSQKEDKVKGMKTWWTYKHIFPFYFAKRNRIASNGQ